jgi:hypothetical protein
LRFGGQPKSLSVPYAAITQFWDPSVDYRLRFNVPEPPPKPAALPPAQAAQPKEARPREAQPKSGKAAAKDAEAPNIVSLDQFRKK